MFSADSSLFVVVRSLYRRSPFTDFSTPPSLLSSFAHQKLSSN
jgi:hypothetical protein